MKLFFINQQYSVKRVESRHYLGQQANTLVFPGYLSGIPLIFTIVTFLFILSCIKWTSILKLILFHTSLPTLFIWPTVAYTYKFMWQKRLQQRSRNASSLCLHTSRPQNRRRHVLQKTVIRAAFKLLQGKLSHFWTRFFLFLTSVVFKTY